MTSTRTQRAQITIEAWERAANAPTFAAAIHPSGATGVNDPEWRRSGIEHAAAWLEGWKNYGDGELPHRLLDFGCGAGRVAIPLAEFCPSVEIIAADASHGMLRRLVDMDPPANVIPWVSDGFDGQLPRCDAIHSIIVLQHYPWGEGAELLIRLGRALRSQGLIGVQLPLYAVEGQSRDWTGVTTWTLDRLKLTAKFAGLKVLEAKVSGGMFHPGSIGEHHGAYHWLRRVSF
jgi:hypothetical protein